VSRTILVRQDPSPESRLSVTVHNRHLKHSTDVIYLVTWATCSSRAPGAYVGSSGRVDYSSSLGNTIPDHFNVTKIFSSSGDSPYHNNGAGTWPLPVGDYCAIYYSAGYMLAKSEMITVSVSS